MEELPCPHVEPKGEEENSVRDSLQTEGGLTAVSLTAGKWKKCSLGRRTQPVCQLCTEQTECLFIASIPGWLT